MLDARLSITLDDWEKVKANKDHEYWLFSIEMPLKNLKAIEEILINKFMGETYGFLGLPWFVWRRINEWVGRDIRNKSRFFTFTKKGTVCSEINWFALIMTGVISSEYSFISEEIKRWLPNNFHSGDNKKVLYCLAKYNKQFKLVEERYL